MANKSQDLTRLGDEKKELQHLKTNFNSFLTEFQSSIATKVDRINKHPDNVEENSSNVCEIILKELTESIMSVKNYITNALKEKDFEPQEKVRNLEHKLHENEIAENKLEQYTRGNYSGYPMICY